ncbi:uncharacterized protein si:dkey-24l11.2 isoform X2 [Carcharodon carcharias]|uniref:uncharacterized protein si:dkey-24l11.2 isoform X2 n=1 Tax=Carcharodon carcharias TaxID=13397 RepID=UPI001B7DD8C4|nr:uncharacterized protein si:dkey-24l11.2 isoform X2 [Carcharodon carcharias]XP_041034330.1 uncharacterized protein si:dkey-24l11.2 isoform X2 [Carcharodon carcharias]
MAAANWVSNPEAMEVDPSSAPEARTGDGMEKTRTFSTSQLKPRNVNAQPPICRFYSRGKYCQFGRRCWFLHEHLEPRVGPSVPENHSEGTANISQCQGSVESPTDSSTVKPAEDSGAQGRVRLGVPKALGPRDRPKRPCRYYLSGYCAMEERCRFWHPERQPPLRDCAEPEPARVSLSPTGPLIRPPISRPAMVKDEVKLTELTQEVARQLRETEISQLMKRFPKDQLIIQESEDGKQTYYRIMVEPTDPDWPFDLKEMDIQICFPDDYPLEVFTVDIPEDQDLPASMGRHVRMASEEWLRAKHATNRLMGKLELLFRPYLRWLDRNMEKLFTEGARQIKRELDAERAGIRIVPYQHLQACLPEAAAPRTADSPADPRKEDDLKGLSQQLQQVKVTESESPEMSGTGSEISSSEEDDSCSRTDSPSVHRRELHSAGSTSGGLAPESDRCKGTAVRLVGLELGEGTATLAAQKITMSLKCSRCKVASDLTVSQQCPAVVSCEKCNTDISVTFEPSMLHEHSDIMGYLDLCGCVPVELVLQDSQFVVGCLNCSKEGALQSLSYGRYKESNCLHCHSKLRVLVEAAQFYQTHAQSQDETDVSNSAHRRKRQPPGSTVQFGKPLPKFGTCKHYKRSYRWLRFPCCGKAYPCDMCHDDDQDHVMELASRMLCGYCAKEQPYNNGKPCVACGAMMTKGPYASHWEGGQGCRNRIKMSQTLQLIEEWDAGKSVQQHKGSRDLAHVEADSCVWIT